MPASQWSAAPSRGGFTLLESLIVAAIIAILLSLLAPAVSRGMAQARGFRCQMSLRSIAFDFGLFADDQAKARRGDDEAAYGPHRFSLETFIESEYRIDEFWPAGETQPSIVRGFDPDRDQMRCAEQQGDLILRRNMPCRAGAIGPAQNVSFGFNSRLFRTDGTDIAKRSRPVELQLRSDILSQGAVPLAWDIDGETAAERGVLPHFSAPGLGLDFGPYADDVLWFPGMRHGGRANFVLIDGSVHSTDNPLEQTRWRWNYQPRP